MEEKKMFQGGPKGPGGPGGWPKRPGGPPKLLKEIEYTDLGGGIYDFACPTVGFHCYLVLGSERAVMIDSGMGIGSLMEKIREITDLPVSLILTHGHPDHGGGAAEFEKVEMWEADFDVYEKMACKEFRIGDVSHMPGGEEAVAKLQPDGPAPSGLADGQEIDLGGRVLKVIYAPGHTHGSVAYFDAQTGSMFTGDNVQGFETTLREWNSGTIEQYVETLKKLKSFNPTVLYGGHGPNKIQPDQIDKYIDCATDILCGAEGEERPNRMGSGSNFVYEKNGVAIAYTKDHIR